MNAVLLIAHAPLATALRDAALHVFPDAAADIAALDVAASAAPEDTLAQARATLSALQRPVLVLADVFGATPCNVAQRLVDQGDARLIAGVNLPMLLRAVSYRAEPLDDMAQRALAGGVQGAMPVTPTAPQNQNRRAPNDQERNDHQQ
ncbi:PTS fructose transporter subunit IIA [Ottowia sp.]|uniref:PTS sugar transporter subunit IIA n=1 Tax=Ottowia sp. TaxID=1898956 RepID=UPI002CAAE936|nr:PTS fructose transporter subunit IIA [Ottowia sp.]HOB66269.1 PTS fructose transporter subunit IIA [Ottowia sp.]HPZ56833.1 PTS fructose transporter subunit IIA [Ottowia sp.]HQD49352.1 PTS fructose transporter subunit IIA [Ottowia sp.]